jgi:hypothetical protein
MLNRGLSESGVPFPLAALEPDEAETCRGALSRIEALPKSGRSRVLKNKSHVALSVLWISCASPAILDAVEDLIGPNLLL